MKKILLVFLILFSFPSMAFMSWRPLYDGKPADFDPGNVCGFFIWNHDGDFRLHATTRDGEKHVFTGIVHTNGQFVDIKDQNFDKNIDFYKLKNDDTIEFSFVTTKLDIGINFKIVDADYMNFELYMDGEKVDPRKIFIGSRNWHPDDYKFTLDHQNREYEYDYPERVMIVSDPLFVVGPWHHHW